MSDITSCPQCQRKLRVTEDLVGQSVKCPSCGLIFTAATAIPSAAAAPPAHEAPYRDAHDDRPRREPRRREDEYDADYDDVVRRRDERPGKVQAIAIMTLVGGILACLIGLAWLPALVCFWPGGIYSIVMGIMAIIKGSKLLGSSARYESPPTGVSIMMIINIINGDIANCVMGIINLVFLSEREVKDYFRA